METRHLRLIKTIADERNITRSAEKLFLTQSAVSHQLKDIEDKLGIRLFYRNNNSWELTEEGKIIYESAEKILNELDRASEKLNGLRQNYKGTIRLSTECFTNYPWLPELTGKLQSTNPELTLSVNLQAAHDTLERLLSNDIDIGITWEPKENKSVQYIRLFPDEVVAILPPNHPLAKREYLEPADFADQTLIIHSSPLESVAVYKYFLKENKITPYNTTVMPLTNVALDMVGSGMGILTMPKWELNGLKSAPGISIKSLGKDGVWRMHYAALRHEDAGKRHITGFIELLKATGPSEIDPTASQTP